MKILFVSPSYYPRVGGVEYVVKSVAERLARRGHEVTVLCGEDRVDKPEKELINGVHVMRWPVWSPGGAYHVPRMRSKLEDQLLNHAKGCDVIHFHSVHSVLTIFSLKVLRYLGAHKVISPHYHGTGHTVFRRIAWVPWRKYVKEMLRYVDVVHAVSHYEAGLIEKDFGVKPTIVEHGVEEWVLNVNWKPSGYAMYSGRIEKYKNIHRFANIIKTLNDMGYSFKLRIFGEGSYKDRLRKHLDKLRVDYEISPPQPYEKYIDTLSKASLIGLLSEREAYGQVVNEANAIGVPVVVAKPWGLNFAGRSRTLIVDLKESDREIARKIAVFQERSRDQLRSEVPSWDKVAELYIERLYRNASSH